MYIKIMKKQQVQELTDMVIFLLGRKQKVKTTLIINEDFIDYATRVKKRKQVVMDIMLGKFYGKKTFRCRSEQSEDKKIYLL